MDGAKLGITEASRAASLFGRAVRSANVVCDSGLIRTNVDRARKSGVQVIVSALGYPATAQLVDAADAMGIVVINAASRSNAFRRSRCSSMFFHVEASDAMYEAAALKSGADNSRITLWSSQLEKYGATQLNDRFASANRTAMSAASWAGWIAVKIAWESFLRTPSGDAAGIARHMSKETTQFDGHKGVPLSFRKWDHQLRQPLYSLSRDSEKVTAEVPDVGRLSGDLRDLFDSIGDGVGDSACSGRSW